MTKKDYVKIASVINKAIIFEGNMEHVNPSIEYIIDTLVDCFQEDNYMFDRKRFLEAVYQ